MQNDVLFPQVKLKLVGEDGNAFAIMGRALRAARRAGLSKADIDEYVAKATMGDYNDLLATTMSYFDCDGDA